MDFIKTLLGLIWNMIESVVYMDELLTPYQEAFEKQEKESKRRGESSYPGILGGTASTLHRESSGKSAVISAQLIASITAILDTIGDMIGKVTRKIQGIDEKEYQETQKKLLESQEKEAASQGKAPRPRTSGGGYDFSSLGFKSSFLYNVLGVSFLENIYDQLEAIRNDLINIHNSIINYKPINPNNIDSVLRKLNGIGGKLKKKKSEIKSVKRETEYIKYVLGD